MSNQPLNNDNTAGLLLTARNLTKSVDALTRQVNRYKRRTIILAVSLTLDVLLTVTVTIFGIHIHIKDNCQAQQNDAFHSSTIASRGSFVNELDGQLGFLDVITKPGITEQQKIAATQAYKQSVLAEKQTLANNPIPTGNCA